MSPDTTSEPRRTGECFVTILPVDPHRVWAFWEVAESDVGNARIIVSHGAGLPVLDCVADAVCGDAFIDLAAPGMTLSGRILRGADVVSRGNALALPPDRSGTAVARFADRSAPAPAPAPAPANPFARNPITGSSRLAVPARGDA